MDVTSERLEEYALSVLAAEQERIALAIREAADRIIAGLTPQLDGSDDPLLDREEAAKIFDVPYWKIRDVELTGKIPLVHRGKKVLARRSDLAKLLKKTPQTDD